MDNVETITNQAKDGKYTWIPGDNVKEGETYAFQVSQGGQENYSALVRAGAPAANQPNQSKESTSEATQTQSTSTSDATTSTSSGTQSTDSHKPLISSPSDASTPSSTPSSTVVTSPVTAGPFVPSTAVIQNKQASATAGMQSSDASSAKYSLTLAFGALAAVMYPVN